MSRVVEAKMTPSKKGWLLTGTQKDMDVIRHHLPRHYLLTPHVCAKRASVEEETKSPSDRKITVSASVRRRTDIEQAALAGGITLVDRDVAPDTRRLRAPPVAKPNKTARAERRPNVATERGGDSDNVGEKISRAASGKGMGAGGGRRSGGRGDTIKPPTCPKVGATGDAAGINDATQKVADTTLTEAGMDVDMKVCGDEKGDSTAPTEELCADTAGGGGDDADTETKKGSDWVRRARRLKIWRVWLMLEASGVDVDAATRSEVGDNRTRMKARLAAALKRAAPIQIERVQTWLRDYYVDKDARKAQRATK
jgi:hypothetical protein